MTTRHPKLSIEMYDANLLRAVKHIAVEQDRSLREIAADMAMPQPMNRLLHGDVGSGKTVVALAAMLIAVESGRQAALMAPTQILAEQHYQNALRLLEPLGLRVSLRTGDKKTDGGALELFEFKPGSARGESAQPHIFIGTHALLYGKNESALSKLGLVVIDEQHKFGVAQRARLIARGEAPDVLVMTATPIPRTAAMTVYGDLDVTVIRKGPEGRQRIVTQWERTSAAAAGQLDLGELAVWAHVRDEVAAGRQAYVVCPLIEETETKVARAAEAEAERLRTGELSGYRVGCLHGRLKAAERRAVMASFKAGELDVLVATTVIEVGVDVPNATIMIVQEADRFGLAQLHQLRGRVGRGAEQSYCLLVSRPREELTEGAVERLEAMVETTDGFELAERDLEIRGEGQLLGARQSGLSDLRFVRLRRDRELLERAREVARTLEDEGLLAEDVDALLGEAEHLGES